MFCYLNHPVLTKKDKRYSYKQSRVHKEGKKAVNNPGKCPEVDNAGYFPITGTK